MKAPTQKPPITERIAAFLATVAEATAGQIARAIGETDYPSRITSALNTLRTDALIECEKKKGKGNELWYWLVSAVPANPDLPAEDLPPGIRPGTRSAQVWHELRDGLELTANALAERMTCSAGAVAPVLSELIKNGTLERRKGLDGYRYFRPQPALQPAAENEAGNDRLERIAHVLRGCGLPELANVQASEDLQVAAAALAGAYITTAADLRAAQAELKKELGRQEIIAGIICAIGDVLPGGDLIAIAELPHAVRALIERAEHIEREASRLATEKDYLARQLAQAPLDVKDAATGYLVRAPKRRLRLLTNPENARTAALAAARTAGRADVLALVPVGRAVRGAEWKAAQP